MRTMTDGMSLFCVFVVTQSCPTLCNPMECNRQAPLSMGFSRQECWSGLPFPSPGGLPDPGIEPRSLALQADALPSEPPGKGKSLSRVRLFATPWTIAYQAPLSMGFSRQECWSGLPFPSPGDLPDPWIEPASTIVSCSSRQILYH